jgi:sec-independent protein translocase protein TatC
MAARQPQTFLDHVHELRSRVFGSVVAFLVGGGLGYLIHKRLLVMLAHPLHQTLYYTTPTAAFNLVMKVTVLVGVLFLLPVATYNAVAFVQPALVREFTKRTLRFMVAFSLCLALMGAAFAFYVVVPMSLKFFAGFKVSGYQTLISADGYLNFVTNCILTFIIMFQLPLVVLFIDRIKPLSPKHFWKYERHVVIGSLIVAVILPFTYDPYTQFLVAIPIIVLYNISMVLVWWARRPKRRDRRAAAITPPPEPPTPSEPPLAPRRPIPVFMDIKQSKSPALAPIMQPATMSAPPAARPRRALAMDIMPPTPRPRPARQDYQLPRNDFLNWQRPELSAE